MAIINADSEILMTNVSLLSNYKYMQSYFLPIVSVTLTNIVASSTYAIFKTSDMSVIQSGISAGTSVVLKVEAFTSFDITIRVTKVGYIPFQTGATVTSSGATAFINQAVDSVYVSNGIDGSTVTEFSVSGSIIKAYINDADNTTSIQRCYAWFQYMLTTLTSIVNQWDYIRAIDQTNYVFYSSIQFYNQKTNALTITGGYFIPSTGGTPLDCYDQAGGPIFMGYPHVVGFSYSGGSGLTTEEHNALINAPTLTRQEMDSNSKKLKSINNTVS